MEILQEEKPVFRIMETQEGFYIQRQFTVTEKMPKKWWQKQKYCLNTEFRSVAQNGGRINIPFGQNPPLSSFKTLEAAKKAIEGFSKYPIYHTLNDICDFPNFPFDRPSPSIMPKFPKNRKIIDTL